MLRKYSMSPNTRYVLDECMESVLIASPPSQTALFDGMGALDISPSSSDLKLVGEEEAAPATGGLLTRCRAEDR